MKYKIRYSAVSLDWVGGDTENDWDSDRTNYAFKNDGWTIDVPTPKDAIEYARDMARLINKEYSERPPIAYASVSCEHATYYLETVDETENGFLKLNIHALINWSGRGVNVWKRDAKIAKEILRRTDIGQFESWFIEGNKLRLDSDLKQAVKGPFVDFEDLREIAEEKLGRKLDEEPYLE